MARKGNEKNLLYVLRSDWTLCYWRLNLITVKDDDDEAIGNDDEAIGNDYW